ncbi:hypothetical protein COCCADRAFT_88392 [Bipolaris zeicola 26-R-13]|uniref:Uncharacterized protein n=1 Tax=Cochliobolus carbonum (strain 26-R-13) TaxID=930089 RepID=W6YY54_COCC2|nr:uncharacterized protein COCCADRAFT_88392 [Bipolaris zeicola 26-R-13]EUC36376.1 hypothetical protein COCCADRAFT_88392 [Bipolaris zeicola 26-R-13]
MSTPSSSSAPTPSPSPPPPRCPSCTSLLTTHDSATHEIRTCATCFVRLRCTESLWGRMTNEEITFFPQVLDDEDLNSDGDGDGEVKEEDIVIEDQREQKKARTGTGIFSWVVGRR